MAEVTLTINMAIKTCDCGTIFLVPNWVGRNYTCPMCAEREKQVIRDERDNAYKRQDHLQKVINGLRGALKKRK